MKSVNFFVNLKKNSSKFNGNSGENSSIFEKNFKINSRKFIAKIREFLRRAKSARNPSLRAKMSIASFCVAIHNKHFISLCHFKKGVNLISVSKKFTPQLFKVWIATTLLFAYANAKSRNDGVSVNSKANSNKNLREFKANFIKNSKENSHIFKINSKEKTNLKGKK